MQCYRQFINLLKMDFYMFLHKVLMKVKEVWEQLMTRQIRRLTRGGREKISLLFLKNLKVPGFWEKIS